MHQRIDASLYGELPGLVRVLFLVAAGRRAVVQVQAELLHLVRMAVLVVALYAEVEVVADGAVVTGLDVGLAVVASVDELVLALVVELVEHRHRAEFRTSQRGEFEMLLAGHR